MPFARFPALKPAPGALATGAENKERQLLALHRHGDGRIVLSGLGGRKAPNSRDKISSVGVLRLRAQRRSAQDDEFEEVLKRNNL
jgi:hypothetical protein